MTGRAESSVRQDVRCPSCGARFSDPDCDGFEVIIPYRASSSNQLAGFDSEGVMILGEGDAGYPFWFGRPQLRCNECRHQWTTSIPWGGFRARRAGGDP